MKCPNCNKEIKDSSKFCRYCGSKIETPSEGVKCPECGTLNRKGATFCDSCGAKLNAYRTSKDIASTTSKSVSQESSNFNNKNLKSPSKIENNKSSESSNNYQGIAILAIICFIIFVGVFALSSHENQKITIEDIEFNIPSGFTENEDFATKSVKKNVNGITFYDRTAGFQDETGENAIYIRVNYCEGIKLTDDDFKDNLGTSDYNIKTINGKKGFFIPRSKVTSNIMGVSEPVDIFAYEQNGHLVFVGVTDESYFEKVIQ